LNVAIISLIGRYIGAGNPDKMFEVIRAGFTSGLIYSSLLAITFWVWRDPLVAIFLEPDVANTSIKPLSGFMMKGLATYVMADAIILVAGGVLRGAGDTRWLMWASILIHWLMLLVQYFVIKVWDLGPKASWIVMVIMVLATGATYLWRLSGTRWRTPEAFARVMAEH
jgi:MATE family multidrug resistance protein